MIYDYEEGEIVDRGQGWNAASPQNLYDHAETYDEYTADADVVRTYPDYKLANRKLLDWKTADPGGTIT